MDGGWRESTVTTSNLTGVPMIGKHVVGQRGLGSCAEDGRPRLSYYGT